MDWKARGGPTEGGRREQIGDRKEKKRAFGVNVEHRTSNIERRTLNFFKKGESCDSPKWATK
jgi:hypothetical protein